MLLVRGVIDLQSGPTIWHAHRLTNLDSGSRCRMLEYVIVPLHVFSRLWWIRLDLAHQAQVCIDDIFRLFFFFLPVYISGPGC